MVQISEGNSESCFYTSNINKNLSLSMKELQFYEYDWGGVRVKRYWAKRKRYKKSERVIFCCLLFLKKTGEDISFKYIKELETPPGISSL